MTRGATDAHQTKKCETKPTARVPPEVLQRIATYLPDGKMMYAFLSALLDTWHTPPMAALATLYEDVDSGELANVNMTWLWPQLDMWNLMPIPNEHAPVFQAYAPMLPRVEANPDFHRQLRLRQDFPVEQICVMSSEELAAAVNNWSQLDSLKLTQSPSALPTQHLCDALPRLPALRQLDITWHGDAHPEEMLALFDALLTSNVTELWLRYDTDADTDATPYWTETEVAAFARWLGAKPITTVGLVCVPIADDNAQALSRALLQSHTLKYLHVDEEQLPRSLFNLGLSLPNQLETLSTYVRHIDDVPGFTQTIARSNLRKLAVGACISLEQDMVMTTDLMHAITGLPRLRELTIAHAALPMPTIVELSKRLPSLRTLRLRNTQLGDVGMEVLARALPNCRHLETLDLSDQKCTHLAAERLAPIIRQCPSLKNLNMDHNSIGSRGLCALLAIVRCLDTLSLQNCGAKDAGAYALCSVMDSTDHLYQLDLSGNLFSKDAVKSIIRVVSKRPTRWGTVCLCNIVDDEEELDKCLRCAKKYLRNASWCTL